MMAMLFTTAFAAEQVVYTLDTSDGEKTQGSSNAYANNCDVEVDGITWNVNGNAQQHPWRLGGKSMSNTDRTVYTKTATSQALTKVTMEIGSASSVTINSIKMLASANADFSNPTTFNVSEIDVNKTYEFEPEAGFAAGTYFKFVFNLTVSATSNKFVEFKKVQFYGEGQTPQVTVAKPTISGTTPFDGSTYVSLACETEGATIYYTQNGDTPTVESAIYSVPISITSTTTIKAIAVKDGVESAVATQEFVKYYVAANVADFNTLPDNTLFKFAGKLVVSAQTGKYLYAQDETGGIYLYGTAPTYKFGDVIPAGFAGKKTTYGGAPEATDLTGLENATETAELKAKVLTVDEVADNMFVFAVIKDALIDTEKTTLVTDDGEVAYFDRLKLETIPSDEDFYNVYCVTSYFNKVQVLPVHFEKVPTLTSVTIMGHEVELEAGADFSFLNLTEEFTEEDVVVVAANANDLDVDVEVVKGWLEANDEYTVVITVTNQYGDTVLSHKVYVTVETSTGINDINVNSAKVVKMIENGQVVIVKGNKKYNVAGQAIK